ncbi:MAG: capsule assembly Wzi family protein [Tunicatimonas sp.]
MLIERYQYIFTCWSVFLLLLLLPYSPTSAQDTIRYQIGSQATLASQQYLPHYSTASRFGIFNDTDRIGGLLRAQASANHAFTDRWSLVGHIDVVSKWSSQSHQFWLQQGYLALRYRNFELSGGRLEETTGSQPNTLSSGSLGISGNTRPIPRLKLALAEYTKVPFTRGYLQVKGSYVHGWLGPERHVANAYLHEKSVYGKLGGKLPVNLYGGLTHFVIWGGKTAGVEILNSFEDYLRVITGRGAADNVLIGGEVVNAAGDHLGVYELGTEVTLKNFKLQIYQQTPFEDASGNNPFNGDRLLGIGIKSREERALVSGVLYEFLHTTRQSGPGRTDPVDGISDADNNYGYRYGGRDNYYNNYLYKTGWTYQDRIIGTPLFFTKARAKRYIPGFSDPDEGGFDFNVVNNRIIAHHLGIEGYLKTAHYKLMGTFTKNYGTYGGINGGIQRWGSIEDPDAPYAFRPPQRQIYFLLEVESHPFSAQWSLLTSLAVDAGQLTDNVGVLLGLRREGVWTRQQ